MHKIYILAVILLFSVGLMGCASNKIPFVYVEDIDGNQHLAFDVPDSCKDGDIITIEKVKSSIDNVDYQWNFSESLASVGNQSLGNFYLKSNLRVSVSYSYGFPFVEVKMGGDYYKRVKIVMGRIPYE